jgi:hypothetical protein
MKWEERWTYDLKTFKPKAVKVRNKRKLHWNNKTAWDGAGGKTYLEGETLFSSEGAARDGGIVAAKAVVKHSEESSVKLREEVARLGRAIEENEAEGARIKKLLMKMGVTL